MQWEAKMATGVAKVDAQHKELIRQVNEPLDAMREGKGRQIIGDVLAFLGKYAVEHFAAEEALMQRHGYPGYAEHKAIHEAFKRDFGALAAEYDRNPEKLSVTIQVQRRVMDWLRGHILGTDQEMGAFLRGKGVV
ncbi:bacteriohemerythrin [Deferrisoma sp.]